MRTLHQRMGLINTQCIAQKSRHSPGGFPLRLCLLWGSASLKPGAAMAANPSRPSALDVVGAAVLIGVAAVLHRVGQDVIFPPSVVPVGRTVPYI